MTSPTPNQDELEIAKFADKWATHFAKHGTGYHEHSAKDMEFIQALNALIDRTVAERLEAIIGEDEELDGRHQSDLKKDGRNQLRAQLRTAAQQQKGTDV